jgi:hypothetical protein
VKWWQVAFHIALVVGGVIVSILIHSEGLRWGWFGLFVGAGFTGLITEVFSVRSRRDEEALRRQLLEPARSRARSAYRIGEFFFPFAVALQEGKLKDRHVVEVSQRAGSIGIEDTIQTLIRNTKPADQNIFATVDEAISASLSFAGEDTLIFYSLGKDLLALRSADAKKSADARRVVAARVGGHLDQIRAYTAPTNVQKAWQVLNSMWDEAALGDAQLDALLGAIHAFLLTLGADQFGARRLPNLINRFSRTSTHGSSRNEDIDTIVREVEGMLR